MSRFAALEDGDKVPKKKSAKASKHGDADDDGSKKSGKHAKEKKAKGDAGDKDQKRAGRHDRKKTDVEAFLVIIVARLTHSFERYSQQDCEEAAAWLGIDSADVVHANLGKLWPRMLKHMAAAIEGGAACATQFAELWELGPRLFDEGVVCEETPRLQMALESCFERDAGLRRVPLALLLAWLLEVVWTTDAFVRGVYNIIALAPESMGIQGIVASFVHSFLGAQFGIFTLAIVYNVRVYWQHSDELAALPWDDLKHDSTAPEPEGWEGVSLPRIRHSGQRSAAVYMGAAWASLHTGSIICSAILSIVYGLVTACVNLPMVRTFMWERVLSPLAVSAIGSVLTLVVDLASRRCLWGEHDQFPRRVGCLVLHDLTLMVFGFAASAVIAITRVVKSLSATVVGLLSVTNPGAHELTILPDGIHEYYLYVLWQERFKLEVDRGGIEVQEPVRGCRPLCSDCARFMAIWAVSIGVLIGLAYFVQWLMVGKVTDPFNSF